jgi:xanthine dehydrogenase accessory factor
MMREILPEIESWRRAGKQIAVATIVQVYGSALRQTGAKMACTTAGDIAGSVSGGCVEGAVYEAAQQTMQTGRPQLLKYGIADETAWEVGLACGGAIQVWVERLDEQLYPLVKASLDEEHSLAVTTVIEGAGLGSKLLVWPDGRRRGSLGSPELDEKVIPYAGERLSLQEAGSTCLEVGGEPVRVFVDVFPPPPRLVIVGAVHIAIPLVTYARTLGFHTVVVDARAAFATRERFPHADELIVDWPPTALEKLHLDESTSVVLMTHDDKFDLPTLQTVLAKPVRYVGILGSVKTHAKRIPGLKELGVTDEQQARIHAPIGLELGAAGPEEIALATMAEIIAVRHGVKTASRVLGEKTDRVP